MMYGRHWIAVLACMCAVAASCLGSALAGEICPAPVIKMVVPNPPGGTGDMVARLLSDRASVDLGQPVVIENISGASTVIGTPKRSATQM